MSLMLNEIHEQPDVIGKLVAAEKDNAAALAEEIEKRGIKLVMLVARGTSDHAAIYGKYILEIHNGMAVALADPSTFTLYDCKINLADALVIGISQSGESTDVAEYLQKSKSMGALTTAITNEPGSKLTKIADHTILLHAGKEKAVAATKTYTATLAAMYLISASIAKDEARINRLVAVSDAMKTALALEPKIAARAERYRYMKTGTVIGRGLNFATALETALKLSETNYVAMRAYSAADLQHGPIAVIDEGHPCFLFVAPGKAYASMVEMADKLLKKNAELIVISSDDAILSKATIPVKLDVDLDEDLSPLAYILPSQLFAYYLALAHGYDPDQPRGLSKVTLTR